MSLLLSNLRDLEQRATAQAGIPTLVLMENAGKAVAHRICSHPTISSVKNGVILCGPGNNGGDGFAIARLLLVEGFKNTTVIYTGTHYRGDALVNLEQLLTRPITVINTNTHESSAIQAIERAEFVVDALFGSGLSRSVQGVNARLIDAVNARHASLKGRCIVFAVDIPSGVSSETGQVMGIAIQADETVTLALAKPGLYLQPGKSLSGKIYRADIGIPDFLIEEANGGTINELHLLNLEAVSRYLPPHPPEAHKYTFGHVAVLAGSESMPGASVLCSESAMMAGAGLVSLLAPKAVFSQIHLLPEIMRHASQDTSHWTKAGMETVISTLMDSKKIHALALGPGLGRDVDSIQAVKQFITFAKEQKQFPPTVLDADALFALAELNIPLNERFIMTPHVGEASRLLGVDSSELSADLLIAAKRLRERYQCHVVLKSATTVMALHPEGEEAALCWISPWGNSGMATAGSGDVLTGILAAQLGQAFAQNLSLSHAILLGVALHGLSGDFAAEAKTVYACHASDIRLHLPDAYKLLKSIEKT